jgi:acetoin utilization deacetylase AcuC-like enzyme
MEIAMVINSFHHYIKYFNRYYYPSFKEHHYQHQLHHHRDSDDSDSDGSELIVARKTKSLAERIREELDLSDENDDDDDDEVLATHREEMIEFMIHVHQRKKRAIEKYQKSQEVKNHKKTDCFSFCILNMSFIEKKCTN